ncbi:hypothetical protein L9H26_04310 [Morganella psychrotolerans]|uniref:gp53-like domain-containing protein n=1 Tax=Morganella psychrotolerans TaxID=368603 RepID=UPI000B2F20FB|nr:hypothetical protein [Morganella psychrotolerans]
MTKIFKVPFATQGDRAAIPDDIQADGSLSYVQGYGYDYERDQVTDPAAKDIEREKMNGIFYDITGAVGELQAFGMPVWAVEGKPYAVRAVVYHNKKAWQSKVENNNIEPVAGAAWAELKADLTAGDIDVYTKGDADKRYQPLGNYQAAGYSYSKAESDTNYQPKGNYAPTGNYAYKGDSYTKAEGDTRYQAKGNYAPAADYAMKGDSYTKAEADNRHQPKGNYQAAGYGYSKAESDSSYQPKGNYAPTGNYAYKGDSYTKSESDDKYQPKGNYQAAGYSYSKAESDNRYQPKGQAVGANTANKAIAGWWKCGNTGIMHQWNTQTWYAGQSLDFKFPIAFPNACIAVMVTDSLGYQSMGTKNRSRTGFTLTGNQSSLGFSYFAIGY